MDNTHLIVAFNTLHQVSLLEFHHFRYTIVIRFLRHPEIHPKAYPMSNVSST